MLHSVALLSTLATALVVDQWPCPPPDGGPCVVDLGANGTGFGISTQVAVLSCIGLLNRPGPDGKNSSAAGYYSLMGNTDLDWLKDTVGVVDPESIAASPDDFLGHCAKQKNVRGYILYNATADKVAVPAIITMAGVLDAVPLEASMLKLVGALPLVLNASHTFSGMSELEVTQHIYHHYGKQTTTLAKMDPGYDRSEKRPAKPLFPALTGNANVGLTDFIVRERLFNFYLWNGCIPGTPEHAFQAKMAKEGPWPTPIRVYGYDDTWPFAGGDTFEAETDCNREHNMGQVASSGVNNLAFFSRSPAVTTPLTQNSRGPPSAYNTSKSYVAFIVGDGDNVAYVKGGRRAWMEDRVKRCAAGGPNSCPPLLWSMSPHVLDIAPDWLYWYYDKAAQTGADWFTLPPSGDLYAYPSLFPANDQATFVRNTELDATLMDASTSTSWEWFGTWRNAIDHFFPRYGDKAIIRGLWAVNVPFMLPVLEFGADEHYKILGSGTKKTVLFKPSEYRGPSCKPAGPQCKSTKDMAATINSWEAGTVAHFYVTSDGGASLGDVYDIIAGLDEHVEVTNDRVLIDSALARG